MRASIATGEPHKGEHNMATGPPNATPQHLLGYGSSSVSKTH